jgi:hypothetical protein
MAYGHDAAAQDDAPNPAGRRLSQILAPAFTAAFGRTQPEILALLERRLDLDTMRVVRSTQDREADPLCGIPFPGIRPAGPASGIVCWRMRDAAPWEMP